MFERRNCMQFSPRGRLDQDVIFRIQVQDEKNRMGEVTTSPIKIVSAKPVAEEEEKEISDEDLKEQEEKIKQEKIEKEKLEQAKEEKEKLQKEQAEKDKAALEKAEKEKLKKETAEKEKAEQVQKEKEEKAKELEKEESEAPETKGEDPGSTKKPEQPAEFGASVESIPSSDQPLRFSGSAPSIWKGSNDDQGFSFKRDKAVVPAPTGKDSCRGAEAGGSVDGWFDYDAPESEKAILQKLQDEAKESKPGRASNGLCYGTPKVSSVAIDDFKGYILETDEHYCGGYYSGIGFVSGDATASGKGWVIKNGKAIQIRYRVYGEGCYDNRHRSFIESQTKAGQSEAQAILAGLHLVNNGKFSSTPYIGPKLDGSDMLKAALTAFPAKPSFWFSKRGRTSAFCYGN